jgi:site-specific DNA-methyltransferase (adenine-specific)
MKVDKTRTFNMDCLEFMASVPDKFYDLAIVDPPYGIGMDGGNVGYKGNNNFQKKKLG